METIKTQSELLFLLERAAHDNPSRTSQQDWKQAYDEFCIHLEQISSGLKFIPVMRTVEHLRIDLTALLVELETGTNDMALSYCKKALETVRSELQMLDLRLQYPGLFSEKTMQFPLLYLSSEYTLTDLVELIVALYEMEVFRRHDGRKAHLISLIRIFEMAFNVSLPNFEVMRTAALNRKNYLTKFLDRLRSTIIDLSQR